MANYLEQQLDDNRKRAIGQTDRLLEESRSGAQDALNRWGQRNDALETAYQPLLQGQGGYTPIEADRIRQAPMMTDGMTTDAERQGNFLTTDEQGQIRGNPNAVFDYFDPEAFRGIQQQGEGAQQTALNQWRSGYSNVLDNPALDLDQGAAERIRLTPQQQQDMVTGAGITAGTRYRAVRDQMERRARAAGVDPLGVMAMRSELDRTAAADSGDAMTQARIVANREAADREMGLEDRRLAATQYRTGAGMQAATNVGQAGLNTAAQNYQTRLGTEGYLTNTGTQLAQGADDRASQRSGQVATNRQATQAGNLDQRFNQRLAVADRLSDAEKTIGAARMQEGAEARANLQHRADVDMGINQQEKNRQLGAVATQQQGLQGTMGQQIGYELGRPSDWDRGKEIIGAGIGAIRGIFGGGKADGGVVTEPTYVLVGEVGPVAIVPLNPGPHAKRKTSGYDLTVAPPSLRNEARSNRNYLAA